VEVVAEKAAEVSSDPSAKRTRLRQSHLTLSKELPGPFRSIPIEGMIELGHVDQAAQASSIPTPELAPLLSDQFHARARSGLVCLAHGQRGGARPRRWPRAVFGLISAVPVSLIFGHSGQAVALCL
jgi:hypothetical protein